MTTSQVKNAPCVVRLIQKNIFILESEIVLTQLVKTMIKVGDKIRVNKSEGFVTKILGNYCLIKFKSGEFSFNMLSIRPEQIIETNKERFLKLVSKEKSNTLEKAKWRVKNREAIREKQKKDLQKAIESAKDNLSKITDVDKHINECKGYE